jgi:hypothetical protein
MAKGTLGIIHMYQDQYVYLFSNFIISFFSIIESSKLKNILAILAKKHPTRKFM